MVSGPLCSCTGYIIQMPFSGSISCAQGWVSLGAQVDSQTGDEQFQALAKYAVDLTAKASVLDPVSRSAPPCLPYCGWRRCRSTVQST